MGATDPGGDRERTGGHATDKRCDPLMAAQANGKTASHVPRWTPTFAMRSHGFRQLREK